MIHNGAIQHMFVIIIKFHFIGKLYSIKTSSIYSTVSGYKINASRIVMATLRTKTYHYLWYIDSVKLNYKHNDKIPSTMHLNERNTTYTSISDHEDQEGHINCHFEIISHVSVICVTNNNQRWIILQLILISIKYSWSLLRHD